MEKVIALFAISRPVNSPIVGAPGEPTRPDTISPTASGYAQGSPLTGVLLPGINILGTNRCARLRLLMLGFLVFFNVLAQTPSAPMPPPAFKNLQPAAIFAVHKLAAVWAPTGVQDPLFFLVVPDSEI